MERFLPPCTSQVASDLSTARTVSVDIPVSPPDAGPGTDAGPGSGPVIDAPLGWINEPAKFLEK